MLNGLNVKGRVALGGICLALLVPCVLFVDVPVALLVREHLYRGGQWSQLTSDLPDLLLLLVLAVTAVAGILYLTRSTRGIFDETTSFDKVVAWTAPCAYLAKTLLKFVFGRVNTRCWLQEPDLYGFHWFQRLQGCEGFPSGHMLVVVALVAAVWRFYPRSRPFCLTFSALLGTALVATNYHFVSDVLAGALAGVLVESLVAARLLRRERS